MPATDLVPFDFGGSGIPGDQIVDFLGQNNDPTDWSSLVRDVGNFFTAGGGPLPRALFGSSPSPQLLNQGPTALDTSTPVTVGHAMVPDEMSFSTIREHVHDKLGFYVKRKEMVRLLRKFGIAATTQFLGLSASEGVWLLTQRRHTTRRHYVQTMCKVIAKAERFRHMLRKSCGGALRARARPGAAPRRGRRR